MLKVYIAGAYSADNVIDVLRNIGRGQSVAADVFALGHAPFCPWLDKEFILTNWDCDYAVSQFLDYSMEWLKVSDCLLVVPNIRGMKDWQDSAGTLAEIQEATRLNIPVYYDIGDLRFAVIKSKIIRKNNGLQKG